MDVRVLEAQTLKIQKNNRLLNLNRAGLEPDEEKIQRNMLQVVDNIKSDWNLEEFWNQVICNINFDLMHMVLRWELQMEKAYREDHPEENEQDAAEGQFTQGPISINDSDDDEDRDVEVVFLEDDESMHLEIDEGYSNPFEV